MEDWEKRLTPWDIELAIMVESLTGKPCELCNGGDHFFFEADYENHAAEPEYLLALWDAIEGRTGKRLLGIDDDPDRHAFIVTVMFSNERYPALIRLDRDAKENPSVGTPYYSKTDDVNHVLAVQVERGNDAQLLTFIGNGQMLIGEDKIAFQFLNASGSVYADAPEHSYIVYRGPGRFEIIEQETFEKEFRV